MKVNLLSKTVLSIAVLIALNLLALGVVINPALADSKSRMIDICKIKKGKFEAHEKSSIKYWCFFYNAESKRHVGVALIPDSEMFVQTFFQPSDPKQVELMEDIEKRSCPYYFELKRFMAKGKSKVDVAGCIDLEGKLLKSISNNLESDIKPVDLQKHILEAGKVMTDYLYLEEIIDDI
jgi:hypothetical protein